MAKKEQEPVEKEKDQQEVENKTKKTEEVNREETENLGENQEQEPVKEEKDHENDQDQDILGKLEGVEVKSGDLNPEPDTVKYIQHPYGVAADEFQKWLNKGETPDGSRCDMAALTPVIAWLRHRSQNR